MTKMPLDWHKNCLKNQLAYLAERERALERIRDEVTDLDKSTQFYKEQIAEAEQRGLDGFDRDRFMIPRPKKK